MLLKRAKKIQGREQIKKMGEEKDIEIGNPESAFWKNNYEFQLYYKGRDRTTFRFVFWWGFCSQDSRLIILSDFFRLEHCSWSFSVISIILVIKSSNSTQFCNTFISMPLECKCKVAFKCSSDGLISSIRKSFFGACFIWEKHGKPRGSCFAYNRHDVTCLKYLNDDTKEDFGKSFLTSTQC